ARSRLRQGGIADPTRDVDEQAAPKPGTRRRRRGRSVAEHRCDLATLRADPRYEDPETRSDRPDGVELGRRGRSHDEADRPAGAPARDVPRDANVERLRWGVDFGILGHDE